MNLIGISLLWFIMFLQQALLLGQLDGAILVSYIQVSSRTCDLISSKWVLTTLSCLHLHSYYYLFIFTNSSAQGDLQVSVNFRYTYRIGHRLFTGQIVWGHQYSFKASPYPGEDSLQRVVVFGDMGKVCIRYHFNSMLSVLFFPMCRDAIELLDCRLAMELSAQGQLRVCWFLAHRICILVKLWTYNEMKKRWPTGEWSLPWLYVVS
jgi:hypothetical protein